jgi:hypothetical protein
MGSDRGARKIMGENDNRRNGQLPKMSTCIQIVSKLTFLEVDHFSCYHSLPLSFVLPDPCLKSLHSLPFFSENKAPFKLSKTGVEMSQIKMSKARAQCYKTFFVRNL